MSIDPQNLNGRYASIKGRVILTVAIILIISFGLLSFNNYRLHILDQEKNMLTEGHFPGQQAVHLLTDGINQSVYLILSYLENGDESSLRQWEEIWQSQVTPSIGKIESEINAVNKADASKLYDKIKSAVFNIESEENLILSSIRNDLKSSGFYSTAETVQYDNADDLTDIDGNEEEEDFDNFFYDDDEDTSSAVSTLSTQRVKEDIYQKIHSSLIPLSIALNNDSKILLNHINDRIKIGKASLDKQIQTLTAINFAFGAVLLICGISLGFFIIKYVKTNFIFIKELLSVINQGGFPSNLNSVKSEGNVIVSEIRKLTENLKNLKSFALKVGNGEFDNNINVFDNQGELGESLAEMRSSLSKVAKEDRNRNWANEGISMFSEIIRKNGEDNQKLCDQLITNLVKYTNSSQGMIFLEEESDEFGFVMEVKSCYALNRKKHIKRQIIKGEGVAGQSWQENDTIYLSEVPENYIQITSGLGHASPRNVLVVPLNVNEKTVGLLELASFSEYEKYQIEFIQKVSEGIAGSIISTRVNEKTVRLLQESQQMTEMMRAQEEEMRQNMEELQATQEEMQRTQVEIKQKEFNLNALVNNTDDIILAIDRSYNITVFNKNLVEAFSGHEIKEGQSFLNLYSPEKQNHIKGLIEKTLQGTKVSEMEEKRGKVFEVTYYPIKDYSGRANGVAITKRDVSHLLTNA